MQTRRFPLFVAGAAALALAIPAAPAAASKSQFSIFEAPRELNGSDDALRQETLDEIQAFGVTHIRALVYWRNVVTSRDKTDKPADFDGAQDDSAGYDWSNYDALFREAAERGIEVIPTLTGPVPTWATAAKRGHLRKPSTTEFQDFVEAAGKRYGSQVSMWTIWNEPNQPQFLGPQYENGKPASPRIYRGLYQAALRGLQASGNGSDDVLAGETAPFGSKGKRPSPTTFAKLFLRGKKLRIDGYAHHPYSLIRGPFSRGSGGDVSIASLGRLEKTLNRAGYRRTPLYLTEFGVQSKPDPFAGVPLLTQNDYRNRSEQIAWANPRVRAFSQYLMRDDPNNGSEYPGFESGLQFTGGRDKPAFDGYRLPLVADRKGKRVKLWGLVRPADGRVTVKIQQRDGTAWEPIGTARTNARGYWTDSARFIKGRVFRVQWGDFVSPPARIR